jgi:tripartite-type tricarboxylate transporter receptor subunit TctC
MRTMNKAGWAARFGRLLGIAALAVGVVAGPAAAQDNYPSKPVRVVVPYPPGGGADFLARLLAERAQSRLGQTVIVENRAGSGGNVGTEFVARAEPDGHTLLFTAQPPLVANKALYSKLAFDPDVLAPVAVMATGYSVLLVHPKVPARTLQEFIAYARANPGKLNYASQGIGNAAHLTAELFNSMAGTRMVHIPYKGTAPALADLLSGQVEVMFGELATAGEHVRAGKLRLLGTGGARRHPDYPDIPAIIEALPGFQAMVWQGMVAPPGTPAAVANRWAGLINEVLQQPDVVKRLNGLSMIPAGGTPADMGRFLTEERQRWGTVIRATGAKAD